MWCLTNDRDIDSDSPIGASLKDVYEIMDCFPLVDEYDGPEGGPFFGMENENNEVIQYCEFIYGYLLLDIPLKDRDVCILTINAPVEFYVTKEIFKKIFEGLSPINAFLSTKRKKRKPLENIIGYLDDDNHLNTVHNKLMPVLIYPDGYYLSNMLVHNWELANKYLLEFTKHNNLKIAFVKPNQVLDLFLLKPVWNNDVTQNC